jgi:hypothetical protein
VLLGDTRDLFLYAKASQNHRVAINIRLDASERSHHLRTSAPSLPREWTTDDTFETWILSYPHLEKLSLNVRSINSHWISETRLIGKSCPKLNTLSMDGIHDIGAWRVSSQPLFPSLLELELGQLKPWPFSTRYVESGYIFYPEAHMRTVTSRRKNMQWGSHA